MGKKKYIVVVIVFLIGCSSTCDFTDAINSKEYDIAIDILKTEKDEKNIEKYESIIVDDLKMFYDELGNGRIIYDDDNYKRLKVLVKSLENYEIDVTRYDMKSLDYKALTVFISLNEWEPEFGE